ncbi:MAG: transporter [Flavobacterium sp.]|nr:transporter [Flavobacterium sp.]
MYKFRYVFYLVLLLFPLVNHAQYTDQINSNRPGETMSAFAVGKSVIQLETGAYGIAQKHHLLNYVANGFGIDATIRYGVFKEKLELIADLQYQSQVYEARLTKIDQKALKQTIIGAKYLLYDPFKSQEKKINVYSWKVDKSFKWKQLIPAVSVFAGANITSANNPYHFSPNASISPKVILITQNHFGDGSWVFVTNTIADYIGSEFPSYSYAVTLTKGINKNWSGFIENQGYKSDFYSDLIVRSGAAFLVNDDLQLDISGSASLKDTPAIFYGGIGLSWRYDGNYKEVRTPIEEDPNILKAQKKAEKKAKKGGKKKKFLIF